MEENGFYYLENVIPLARIRSVLKKWFPLISVTVLSGRKELSSKVNSCQKRENPSPVAGMKDSLKNTYGLKKAYGLH